MSARSFRSVFMVASCAGAALGCYLVSLRVASERAALENVETKIVLAQRDLRLLQTEIGTRGRLAQLERWNVKVLALSAPSADQFLNGGFELAKMVAPQHKIDLDAPVVLASASTDTPKPRIDGAQPQTQGVETGVAPGQLMQLASLKRETPVGNSKAIVSLRPSKPAAKPASEAAGDRPAPAAKIVTPAIAKPAAPKPAAATGKPLADGKGKAAAKGGTLRQKAALADPLAPLAAPAKPRKLATAASKDLAKKQ